MSSPAQPSPECLGGGTVIHPFVVELPLGKAAHQRAGGGSEALPAPPSSQLERSPSHPHPRPPVGAPRSVSRAGVMVALEEGECQGPCLPGEFAHLLSSTLKASRSYISAKMNFFKLPGSYVRNFSCVKTDSSYTDFAVFHELSSVQTLVILKCIDESFVMNSEKNGCYLRHF